MTPIEAPVLSEPNDAPATTDAGYASSRQLTACWIGENGSANSTKAGRLPLGTSSASEGQMGIESPVELPDDSDYVCLPLTIERGLR